MKILIIKDFPEGNLYTGSELYDCIELDNRYYEGIHTSMLGTYRITIPKEYCKILEIKCYCGEQETCDCDPPLPKPKQYTDKEKVNFFHNMLIDLHTFRWTGDGEKVKRVLDVIGGYSYAHTNSNVYDEDDKSDRAYERLVSGIDEIVKSPASWKKPKEEKKMNDSITKDTLEMDGWVFFEISPWTGKPTWCKNLMIDESSRLQVDVYEFSLTLNDYQDISTIRYTGGDYAFIQRGVNTMQEVNDFIKVLGNKINI